MKTINGFLEHFTLYHIVNPAEEPCLSNNWIMDDDEALRELSLNRYLDAGKIRAAILIPEIPEGLVDSKTRALYNRPEYRNYILVSNTNLLYIVSGLVHDEPGRKNLCYTLNCLYKCPIEPNETLEKMSKEKSH